MPLLAVANTKGGQGKTTWACTLASFLDAELLDANPENGDAEAWAARAKHPCRFIYPDRLEELDQLARKPSWTVVDCPPWDGRETRAALALSQVVLIPVGTGYQDLRGLGRMAKLVDDARAHANPRLKAAILGNGRRLVAFSETWEAALEAYHAPKQGTYFLGAMPQRQAIVDAFGDGLPAHHAGQPAARECREILDRFAALLKTK